MTQQQIESIITLELSNNSELTNSHGININNITQYLIKPTKKKLVNPVLSILEEYWVVLDENPQSEQNGYLIVYSEEQQAFGLATKQSMNFDNAGTCIGLYDTFVDSLNAM